MFGLPNFLWETESDKLASDNSIEAMQEARLGGLKLFSDIMIFENQLLSLLEKPSEKVPKLLAVNVVTGILQFEQQLSSWLQRI